MFDKKYKNLINKILFLRDKIEGEITLRQKEMGNIKNKKYINKNLKDIKIFETKIDLLDLLMEE